VAPRANLATAWSAPYCRRRICNDHDHDFDYGYDDGHNGDAELDADEINQHNAFLPVLAVTLHGRGEVMSVHKSLTPRPVGSLGAFVMTQVIQNHFWFVLLF
jgi:hypothetical protein